ncbi:hypothetical protein EDC01DRAFT_673029 [Geopyxis carbonaria]|nr:hypothetical protein EDC01DRAFT_673029 [Geopyxis carbonaria]
MISPKPSPSKGGAIESPYDSPTFKLDMSIKVDAPVGAMSISPSSRDVVLASRQGLHIVDLDNPYDPPRFLQHLTAWSVADVQWCPHASEPNWVVSTSNQNAIVWNLALPSNRAIEFVLKSHTRAITDINFSAHDPNVLATCSIDSFVHCWDLRTYQRPAMSFCDWFAGATQVKYNRTDEHILASAHDKYVYIWDTRMGAKALRKITAHSTKIYGLDWNRTRKTGIITCALDKSVRFWDYEKTKSDDVPERIIHTSYPVWRARHTPFGWGVMTMPQRGDTSLYLWDRRAKGENKDEPVAKFEGHTDHVKEFVWRWRGGQREECDDREFQLVSWSLDRDIRLWNVDKDTVAKIGHDPGKKMRFRVTRKGAKYMTFRDEVTIEREYEKKLKELAKPLPLLTLNVDGRVTPTKNGLRSKSGIGPVNKTGIGQQISMSQKNGSGRPNEDRRFEKSLAGVREGGFMRARRKKRIEMNPITWMKGVKISRKVSENAALGNPSRSTDFGLSWDAPENLGDEISFVGEKFPKVNFEKVNIAARTCTVSLTGPWGIHSKWIFIRVVVTFPEEYPADGRSIPEFVLEKTNIIPDENIQIIDAELKRISSAHVTRRRVCLESCLCYLLGERADNAAFVGSDEEEDSSTDDEEIINSGVNDEEEGIVSSIHRTNQASVPLPKTCGAMWAQDGRLICFFPPKEERPKNSLLSSLAIREAERTSSRNNVNRLFEGFGRLYMDAPSKSRRDNDEDYVTDSSYTSSDDSSDDDTGIHPPTLGWHLRGGSSITKAFRRGGSTDRSTQRSTGTGVKTVTGAAVISKSVVSLHDMSHILPAKKSLATDYRVGEGPDVCRHNAIVAERNGCMELADVWRLVEMVLSNDIPLEIYPSPRSRLGDWGEKIMVMARRASMERTRRDSGLSLEFDSEGEDFLMGASDTEFWGRVKWGGHPMGGRWLIDELFSYFEKKADVQMLAMLSCVLCEQDDKSGHEDVPNAITIPSKSKSKSSKPPAFSRDYYPNIEMIVQPQQSNYSISPSHHSASMTPINTHGSYSSSIGAHFGSDPLLPYSTGTTPPTSHLRLGPEDYSGYGPYSLSSSPEQHRGVVHFRRSNSAISANALGAANASPQSRRRPSPADSMLNAFTTPGGVTWGAITTFGSGSKGGGGSTITEDTTDDNDPLEPIVIMMCNREAFDDEGAISIPLLNQDRLQMYKAYRENYANLLYVWDLPLRRLEVLKFNSADAEPASPVLSEFTRRTRTRGNKWDGLEIAGHCSKCGSVLDVTSGAKGECKACKRRQVTMTCVICEVIIKGLYGPCLKCGHVAHAECHREWFEEGTESCPTGCGCVCLYGEDDRLPILMEPPKVPPTARGGDVQADYMW